MHLRALLLAALVAVAVPAAAHPAGDDHAVGYDLAAAMGLFPSADAVHDAIDAARGHPWVRVVDLGASESGKPLRVVEVTDPDSPIPRSERVVTLLETQQHGNEPAGTGAALPFLDELLKGGADAKLLDNQIVLLLPMSNPDGATANQRANRDGVDVNRDHVGLATSEARAIHAVLNQWDVHVAIDHHEYSGTGLGNPVPVRIYDYDLTLMVPNHGNVRTPTADAARELDYDVLWPAAQAAGYSVGDYGIITVAGIPVQQTAGGPDPGILRNSFGLNNVAGLLAETFITELPDNPFQSAQRRMDIHRLVMDTTLQWAHDNAASIIAAKRESERLNVEETQAEYSEVGEGQTLHGPLAPAYKVKDNLGALFAGHGLPVGVPVDGGFVHNVAGEERAGLVAAILHPLSSRHVTVAEPASPILTAPSDAGAERGQDAPLGLLVALAAVVAALVVARRR